MSEEIGDRPNPLLGSVFVLSGCWSDGFCSCSAGRWSRSGRERPGTEGCTASRRRGAERTVWHLLRQDTAAADVRH